jgi:hypothetical protein
MTVSHKKNGLLKQAEMIENGKLTIRRESSIFFTGLEMTFWTVWTLDKRITNHPFNQLS